jgi:hypothetical protein
MGFRLNSRALLKAERRRKEEEGSVSKLSSGLVISRPKPTGSDYEKSNGVDVYARAMDSPILVGYAK